MALLGVDTFPAGLLQSPDGRMQAVPLPDSGETFEEELLGTLEDLMMSFGRADGIKALVLQELERLKAKGYISEDPEALAAEVLKQLEGRAEQARSTVSPLLQGLGSTLREAMDSPSRSEILALKEALERHERRSDETDPGA